MYSPRIYRKYIPCLYQTSKALGVPMTRLVNTYVHRGLATQAMPAEALKLLREHVGIESTVGRSLDGRVLETGDAYLEPPAAFQHLPRDVAPFAAVDEIGEWYGSALTGVAKGLSLADQCMRARCRRKPAEIDHHWKYGTAVVIMNQLYHDTAVFLLASGMRV